MRSIRRQLGDHRAWFIVLAASLLSVTVRQTVACEGCGTPSTTFSDQYATADAVLLVAWKSAEKASGKGLGTTTWEVVQAPKSPNAKFGKGRKLVLPGFLNGKPGDLSLLMGRRSQGELLDWSFPLEITEAGFKFIADAPPRDAPAEKRLGYYVKFLEHDDPAVALDAYQEFVNAPFGDMLKVVELFPRESLGRRFVTCQEPQTGALRHHARDMRQGSRCQDTGSQNHRFVGRFSAGDQWRDDWLLAHHARQRAPADRKNEAGRQESTVQ